MPVLGGVPVPSGCNAAPTFTRTSTFPVCRTSLTRESDAHAQKPWVCQQLMAASFISRISETAARALCSADTLQISTTGRRNACCRRSGTGPGGGRHRRKSDSLLDAGHRPGGSGQKDPVGHESNKTRKETRGQLQDQRIESQNLIILIGSYFFGGELIKIHCFYLGCWFFLEGVVKILCIAFFWGGVVRETTQHASPPSASPIGGGTFVAGPQH